MRRLAKPLLYLVILGLLVWAAVHLAEELVYHVAHY